VQRFTGGGQPGPAKIVQTSALMLILYADLAYRQTLLDGRPLRPNPN